MCIFTTAAFFCKAKEPQLPAALLGKYYFFFIETVFDFTVLPYLSVTTQ